MLSITANSDEEDSISEGRDGGFTNHEDSSVDVSTSRGSHALSSPLSFVGSRRNGRNGSRNQPPPEGNHDRFVHAFELMYHASQEENMIHREENRQ